jgi:hypothetical protein
MQDFDFGSAEGVQTVTVYSPMLIWGLIVAAIVAYAGLVALSSWWGWRQAQGFEGQGFRLRDFPPAIRLVTAIIFVGFFVVQVVAVIGVYIQTRIIHESTHAYFQYVSWPRMVSLGHVHLFGFFLIYGFYGSLLAMTDMRLKAKCVFISMMLWAGVFDLVAWMGIKKFSAQFEWLASFTGSAIGVSMLVVIFVVGRTLFGFDRKTLLT